jgi:hypothetical protein
MSDGGWLMEDQTVCAILRTLARIPCGRFWETERGFVGQFNAEFQAVVRELGILPAGTVIEEEHQKRFEEHGLRYRPDLIVHVPYDPGIVSSRRQGNYVVFEFKNRGNSTDASEALKKLDEYARVLDYKVGVFVNINSPQCHLGSFELRHSHHVHEFAVAPLDNELVIRHAYRTDEGELIIDTTSATVERPSRSGSSGRETCSGRTLE